MTTRLCPPCDGQCIQGRDCPAAAATVQRLDDNGLTADFVRSARPEEKESLLQRTLRDKAALGRENERLSRRLWMAVAALAVSVAFNIVGMPLPW